MTMDASEGGRREVKKYKLVSNRVLFPLGREPAGSRHRDVGFCFFATLPLLLEKEQDVNHGRRRGEPKEGQRRHHPRQGLRSLLCLLHPAAW